MMLGLGIVFEIPMAIFLLAKIGIATPRWLIRNFRYAVLIIVIVAAIITPTGDPVNLAIFSIPMILLYWVGVAAAAIWGPKVGRFEMEDEDDWDDDEDDEDEEPDEDAEDEESIDGEASEEVEPADPRAESNDEEERDRPDEDSESV